MPPPSIPMQQLVHQHQHMQPPLTPSPMYYPVQQPTPQPPPTPNNNNASMMFADNSQQQQTMSQQHPQQHHQHQPLQPHFTHNLSSMSFTPNAWPPNQQSHQQQQTAASSSMHQMKTPKIKVINYPPIPLPVRY